MTCVRICDCLIFSIKIVSQNMRNCKAFSLAIIRHGSVCAPMSGQDAPLHKINIGGQVPLALPALVREQFLITQNMLKAAQNKAFTI